MKVSKTQLKSLIKECLVELLAEGLGNNLVEAARPPRSPRVSQQPKPVGQPRPSAALRQAVRESSGGDPILQEVLADTAMTTLPSMLSSDEPVSGMHMHQGVEQVNGTPESIFGEENAGEDGRWANLAFSNMPNKSSIPPPSSVSSVPDHVLDQPVLPKKSA